MIKRYHKQHIDQFLLFFLIIFISLESGLTVFSQPVNEQDKGLTEAYMQKGDSLMNYGDYQLAIQSFGAVISYNPEHYQARLNRARCYMNISDFIQAKADINYLIRHNNKDHSLIKFKAKLLYSMGDIYGAETSLQIYVEKVPDDPEGWYLLGLMEKKSGRYRTALFNLDKANKMHGGNYYEALTVMGNIYKDKKDYKEADKLYRLAIGADSTQGLPYYLLGNLKLELFDTLSALRCYDTAVSIDVNNDFVTGNVAKSLLSMGYIDLAIAKYESQIKTDPSSAEAWGNLGVFYLCAERYQKALDCFNQALFYEPTQSQLLYYKGIALIGMNSTDEGRSYILEAAKMGNFYAKQYIALPATKGMKAGMQAWVMALQILQLLKL